MTNCMNKRVKKNIRTKCTCKSYSPVNQWERCEWATKPQPEYGAYNLTILIVLRWKVWHKQKSKTLHYFVVFLIFWPHHSYSENYFTNNCGRVKNIWVNEVVDLCPDNFKKFVQLFFHLFIISFRFLNRQAYLYTQTAKMWIFHLFTIFLNAGAKIGSMIGHNLCRQ